MSAQVCGNAVAAGQQLAVKNVDRIEAINIPGVEKRRIAELYTWVFSRMVRRDFNLTSVKLFFYCKKTDQADLARFLLANLTEEAQVLEDMARPYGMPTSTIFSSCDIRIISDESEELLNALLTADRALHKLMHSPLAEVAEANLLPFMRAYNALRHKVIGFPKRQQADAV